MLLLRDLGPYPFNQYRPEKGMIRPRLPERWHHLAGQTSGGERQMLAVARALMIAQPLSQRAVAVGVLYRSEPNPVWTVGVHAAT
jgi:hypothetical protein